VHREETEDRKNNRYTETVIDPDTGEIIHQADEPLSDHLGHGSAKKERDTSSPSCSPYSSFMAEWLVELQGDPAELGELADQFRSSRLNVREEGERYYLRAPEEFDGLSDDGEVRARATELLFLLSGIANLYAGAGETVTPGNVIIWERDDGTRDQFIQTEAMVMRVRASALL
jgi:hypothetical protein